MDFNIDWDMVEKMMRGDYSMFTEPTMQEIEFEEASKAAWKFFLNPKMAVEMIPNDEKEIIKFINNNKARIEASFDMPCSPVYDSRDDGTLYSYNIFAFDDPSHKCLKCGSHKMLIYKNKLQVDDYSKVVFRPSMEFYRRDKINLKSKEFLMRLPIPIVCNYVKGALSPLPCEDLWICPECLEVHPFYYNHLYGLQPYE